ncbi:MAG: type II toxin-antitoxin system VapB family antitoxin [Myxococcota bacterium]
MATNLNLDDQLIDQAVALGRHSSKREAVNEALREYVAYRRRLEALDVFGTVEFDPAYDYKQARTRQSP